ncbi:MAG: SUMF1/EgtB/PvdO family nonheme iron enzyme [Bacteroidota bacterium]
MAKTHMFSYKRPLNVLFFSSIGLIVCFLFFYDLQRKSKVKRNVNSMILIPNGEYEIGCPFDSMLNDISQIEDLSLNISGSFLKEPQEIRVKSGFYIDPYEVTNEEYEWFSAFMGWYDDVHILFRHKDAPRNKNYKSKYSHDAKFNNKNQPVVGVDWFDAYAYARFLGMYLPSNDQWEYVCKNKGKTIYPWGNQFAVEKVNMDNDLHFTPVEGRDENFLEGATNQFVYHMAGNVSEWTESWENDGFPRMANVRGGGCYQKPGSIFSLCFVNQIVEANHQAKDIGFRVVSYQKEIEYMPIPEFVQGLKNINPEISLDELVNRYHNYKRCIDKIKEIRSKRRMRYVKSGRYWTGPPADNKLLEIVRASKSFGMIERFYDQPLTKQYTKGFYIDSTEVSNSEYARFLKDPLVKIHWYGHPLEPAGKDYIPKFWDDSIFNQPDQPVVGVDWWDAYAYANWAEKRLPTKEEWEIAARSGKVNYYPWGDYYQDSLLVSGELEKRYPENVDVTWSDMSPSGVYNMAGNISEWTISVEKKEDEIITAQAIIKGGNYMRPGKIYSILFLEEKAVKNMRHQSVGFRCVMD